MIDELAKSTDFNRILVWIFENKGLGINACYMVDVSKMGDFDTANIDPDFKNGVLQFDLIFIF
jgi:hypothetical protein